MLFTSENFSYLYLLQVNYIPTAKGSAASSNDITPNTTSDTNFNNNNNNNNVNNNNNSTKTTNKNNDNGENDKGVSDQQANTIIGSILWSRYDRLRY